jgi:protein-S-isoprenylcysteine O-methyltransferase Ste14
MKINGFDKIRQHVPDLNSPLGTLCFFLPTAILLLLVTSLFNTLLFNWPFGQLVAELALGGLGFVLHAQFFLRKQDFKTRFGPLAYSRAASWFSFPAVTIIAFLVARIRSLPGPAIPHFGGYILLPALGWVLVALGALLFLRTLLTFGVDNLSMLYVYFPQESQLVNHRIYSILRHPAYCAAQCIAFGLALLNGGWFALACALIFPFGLWGWVRLVEENELIERFGPSYLDYRKRVPAFWPRLRDFRGFFEFLILAR